LKLLTAHLYLVLSISGYDKRYIKALFYHRFFKLFFALTSRTNLQHFLIYAPLFSELRTSAGLFPFIEAFLLVGTPFLIDAFLIYAYFFRTTKACNKVLVYFHSPYKFTSRFLNTRKVTFCKSNYNMEGGTQAVGV
jgi:hypothetical protein